MLSPQDKQYLGRSCTSSRFLSLSSPSFVIWKRLQGWEEMSAVLLTLGISAESCDIHRAVISSCPAMRDERRCNQLLSGRYQFSDTCLKSVAKVRDLSVRMWFCWEMDNFKQRNFNLIPNYWMFLEIEQFLGILRVPGRKGPLKHLYIICLKICLCSESWPFI